MQDIKTLDIQAFRREMKARGRRMYWNHKLSVIGEVVAGVATFALCLVLLVLIAVIMPD